MLKTERDYKTRKFDHEARGAAKPPDSKNENLFVILTPPIRLRKSSERNLLNEDTRRRSEKPVQRGEGFLAARRNDNKARFGKVFMGVQCWATCEAVR